MQKRTWLGGGVVLALLALSACGKSTRNASDGSDSGGSAGTVADGGSGGSQAEGGSVNGGSGGSGGSGGTPGTGATGGGPESPWPVAQIRSQARDKLDLLLVVDNSRGMTDKQQVFAESVGAFLRQLTNPDCISGSGSDPLREPSEGADVPCPPGFRREMAPVIDMHVAVITTSLGGHGGDICSPNSPAGFSDEQNDRGRLIPTVRPELGLPSADEDGVLTWSAGDQLSQFQSDITESVLAAGEIGCGYEAPLEAWYRFLIDPSPPLDMVVIDNQYAGPATDANGDILVDDVVLAQREAFLRSDSVLAIVMLTDENDCSIMDGGIGWLTAQATTSAGAFTMPPSTAACETNPNDPCCRSCGLSEPSPPNGCSPLDADPACQQARPSGTDALNLRCFHQKERFGFDLLYPIERYVAGLGDPMVFDTQRCGDTDNCPLVPNPLFEVDDVGRGRTPDAVYLAGIAGVPWQDIANDASLADPGALTYMNAIELTQQGRWDVVLGHPEADNPANPAALPGDPLMLESPKPRNGTQPITNEPVADETSTNPQQNAINGHEFINTTNDFLQYACIFPLPQPRDCSSPDASVACDCPEEFLQNNRPLCNPPGGGPAETTQYYAGALPSPRILQVLRDFGDNAVTASVCPKVLEGPPDSPSNGYAPALGALYQRMTPSFAQRCLPELDLPIDDAGKLRCSVVEVSLTSLSCNSNQGRAELDSEVTDTIHEALQRDGACGGATNTPCDNYNLCEIRQLGGSNQTSCLNEPDYSGDTPGFCYLSASLGIGDPALLDGCPASQPHRLRFVGDDTPASGVITYLYCPSLAD